MTLTLESFIAKLEEEIDTIPKGSLKPDTNYRDIKDWSSMHALIIIALADTDYNAVLTGNDLRSCNTVSELFNVIKSKIA